MQNSTLCLLKSEIIRFFFHLLSSPLNNNCLSFIFYRLVKFFEDIRSGKPIEEAKSEALQETVSTIQKYRKSVKNVASATAGLEIQNNTQPIYDINTGKIVSHANQARDITEVQIVKNVPPTVQSIINRVSQPKVNSEVQIVPTVRSIITKRKLNEPIVRQVQPVLSIQQLQQPVQKSQPKIQVRELNRE